MNKFIYPQLSLKKNLDFGFFRAGGPGLANCLFVAARAFLLAKDEKCELLRPTWERLRVGQWLRGEHDKRFYHGLFRDESVWLKLRKALLIWFSKRLEVVDGLGAYFEDILDRQMEVREWLQSVVEPSAIARVPADLPKCVAVHVRMGDFPDHFRMPISWYVALMKQVQAHFNRQLDVLVFSDGSDMELGELLTLPRVRRAFYGNALADMVAISRCGLLIAGKYSTFSAWGAYLGNVPSLFSEIEYGRVLPDRRRDVRIGDSTVIPDSFWSAVKGLFKC